LQSPFDIICCRFYIHKAGFFLGGLTAKAAPKYFNAKEPDFTNKSQAV